MEEKPNFRLDMNECGRTETRALVSHLPITQTVGVKFSFRRPDPGRGA